jgi:hypothetical protein
MLLFGLKAMEIPPGELTTIDMLEIQHMLEELADNSGAETTAAIALFTMTMTVLTPQADHDAWTG